MQFLRVKPEGTPHHEQIGGKCLRSFLLISCLDLVSHLDLVPVGP